MPLGVINPGLVISNAMNDVYSMASVQIDCFFHYTLH